MDNLIKAHRKAKNMRKNKQNRKLLKNKVFNNPQKHFNSPQKHSQKQKNRTNVFNLIVV